MNRMQIAGTIWEKTRTFCFEIKEPCSLMGFEGVQEKIREEIRHRAGVVIIEYLEKHPNEFTRLQFSTNAVQEFGLGFSIIRLTVTFYEPCERS